MGLRHSTKSKYVRNLLRFGAGDKKQQQTLINDVSNLHKDLVKKVNNLDNNSENSEDYGQHYKEQAIKDLEDEILNQREKTGLKFLDDYMDRKDLEANQAAQILLEKIKNDEEISEDGGIIPNLDKQEQF